MNPSNEFIHRANEAVESMAAQPHTPGESVRIFLPVPRGLSIGDNWDEINLDNAMVSPVMDGKARDADGQILFDASKMGADLFLVEGTMKW